MDPTGPNLAGVSRQSRTATERRRVMRHRTHSPAYARLNPAQEDSDLSEILDISEEGMSIQTSSPLAVENRLNLCLDLSETKARIETTGQVVWSETSGRTGIRFGKLTGQSRQQLKEWLFANVLTACDHAAPISTVVEERIGASTGLLSSHTMHQDELGPGNRVFLGDAGVSESEATAVATREKVSDKVVDPRSFNREATLQSIAERALVRSRASGAAIALSDGNDSEMVCVASAGSDAPPIGSRLQVGSGFSGECVRTGRSLRCDDSETDERVDRVGCQALGIRSIVAIPLRPGSKTAGLLEVFSPRPYAFNAEDISSLQQLTGSILSAMGAVTENTVPPPQVSPAVERALEPEVQSPRQKVPSARSRAMPPDELVPAEIVAKTVARPIVATPPKSSANRGLHKALLVSAIATFVFVVLWLIAPWLSKTVGSSERAPSHAQASQPATRGAGLPVTSTDLAGLRKVAERGDPAAQFALGARYAIGEEVPQDYTEAVRWFILAAEQGHIQAQATLGAYYWAGRGVPQDLAKAYYWSVLAQAGGDQASKYRVAVLTSRMSRSQIVAAQQQANDWLTNFASHPPSSQ